MALPAGFLDELRARTPLPALIGRRTRLVRSGRQHKGCCPFHGEKTPSFYVYDDHFHCFGCGAHGDAISFVMQSEGAAFPEAVARLAAEAGLEVPQPSREQAEAERRRLDLHAVLEAAQASFRRRLGEPGGAAARGYLGQRGIAEATSAAWGLGWSGPGRGELAQELGLSAETLAEAGLVRLGEDGRPAGDLFFNRLTFPIRDPRGRVVSFGGRTLGDGQPKYLNGPETPLFSKRRTLFGLDAARAGVRADQPLVLVEGYMDVIAMHQAGFSGAVAPLGTAVTEEQLEALWTYAPMPHLCFDGDAAGARAAVRAVELALPKLTAERSLKVVRLPAGEDPDSLLRNRPAAVMAGLLQSARPLGETLFDLLSEGAGTGPEARAALRTRLEAASGRIGDRALAREIRSALLDRFFTRPARKGAVRVVARGPVPDSHSIHSKRWLTLAGLLLRHSSLRHHGTEMLSQLPAPAGLQHLADILAGWHDDGHERDGHERDGHERDGHERDGHELTGGSLDSDRLLTHLAQQGLADAVAQALDALGQPRPDDPPPEQAWRHYFSLMHADRLDDDIAHTKAQADAGDMSAFARLIRLKEEKMQLTEVDQERDHY